MSIRHSEEVRFNGVTVWVFRSELDDNLCVQIETDELCDLTDEHTSCNVRVYYNDSVATGWDGEEG